LLLDGAVSALLLGFVSLLLDELEELLLDELELLLDGFVSEVLLLDGFVSALLLLLDGFVSLLLLDFVPAPLFGRLPLPLGRESLGLDKKTGLMTGI
jgi:hypothetical protein